MDQSMTRWHSEITTSLALHAIIRNHILALMTIKGYEISQFWFFFCTLCYISLLISYWEQWDSSLSAKQYWYYIPEAMFGLILIIKMLASAITKYKKYPDCTCAEAAILHRVGSGIIYPDDSPPFWTRTSIGVGKVAGIYSLVCFITALIIQVGGFQVAKFRFDHVVVLGLLGMMLFGLQITHYICLIYFSQLIVESVRIRLTAINEAVPDNLEDVIIQQGPADVSAYFTLMTESMHSNVPDCPICSDPLDLGTEVAQLPCTHIFHSQCAAVWLGITPTCPICRVLVPLPLQQEEPAATGCTSEVPPV